MPLWKTTILPTDSADAARRILEELIYEEPLVLLLVFGASADAETLVDRASKHVGAAGEPWWIVWIRDPDGVQQTLSDLKNPQGLDLQDALGVVLNWDDEIHRVFPTLPSHLDIRRALVSGAKL